MRSLTSLSLLITSALAQSSGPPYIDPYESLADNIKPFINVLIDVNNSVIALDNAILSFQGIQQVAGVADISAQLLAVISNGTNAVMPLPDLTLNDSDAAGIFAIGDYVTSLGYFVNLTVVDLVDRKQVFVDACAGPIVLDQITKQNQSAADLEVAIINKLPEDDQGLGYDIASTIGVALESGIAAFATETTVPASCSVTTTTTTDGTTTTATTSTTMSTPSTTTNTSYQTSNTASTYTTATSTTYQSQSTSTSSEDCDVIESYTSTLVEGSGWEVQTSFYRSTSVSAEESGWEVQSSFYPTSESSYTVHPHSSSPAVTYPTSSESVTVHPHPSNPTTVHPHSSSPTAVYPTSTDSITVHPHPSNPTYAVESSQAPATTTAAYQPYTGSATTNINNMNLLSKLVALAGLIAIVMVA